MRDLARSTHLSGRPVPVPWRDLASITKPRGGNLMLVLAAGGVGKSTFALEWAMALEVPTLYVSLDTSLVDQAIRVVCRTTGLTVEQVTEGHDEDPQEWAATWGEYLDTIESRTRFVDASPTVDDIDEVVAAETEYWGEAPLLTIVDNLGDLLEAEESAGEYRRLLLELKNISKRHDTLVMALHHTRRQPPKPISKRSDMDEDEDEGTKPVHLSDALFEGDKHAQFALGLWRPNWNQMAVGVLKNRMGPASRTGKLHATLLADMKRMRILDPMAGR